MNWDQLFDKPGPRKSDYDDFRLGPIMRCDAALLAALCNYVQPRVVVEYGSLDGHSAAIFAQFAHKVYCVEADGQRPGLREVCEQNPHVEYVHARMQDWVPPDGLAVDLAYFDASHDFEDSKAAYERVKPHLLRGGLLICHDTAQWPADFHPNFAGRQPAMEGERAWVEWLKDLGWHPIAFGCRTAARHGLTILQRETGWAHGL